MDYKPLTTMKKTPSLKIYPKSNNTKSYTKIMKNSAQKHKLAPVCKTTQIPTTLVFADTISFKHVVQMLTGSPKTTKRASRWAGPITIQPNRRNFELRMRDSALMEENVIAEKGFCLRSPPMTPKEAQPRLLPLFPMTSPRVIDDS